MTSSSTTAQHPLRLTTSMAFVDVDSGERIAEIAPDVVLPVASVGKLLLLIELARRVQDDPNVLAHELERSAVDAVADSGLWQHLGVDRLSVADAAVLVGAVSDNLATNVLIDLVGLDAIDRCRRSLGLQMTRLHDRVRDRRSGNDPATLSTATTGELAELARRIERDEVGPDGAGTRVAGWLRLGTDLSMVASVFGVDPLAHALVVDAAGDDIELWNKTGTDAGVLADVGVVRSATAAIAYAAIVTWTSGASVPARSGAMAGRLAMREIGERLVDVVTPERRARGVR